MIEVLERVAGVFRKREQEKADDFCALVRQVAGDKASDPEDIAAQLSQFDRTPEELDKAVEYRRRRQALAAELATVPDLQKQFDVARQAEAVEVARWKKLVEEHDALAGPLRSRVLTLDQALARARGCQGTLREIYEGPLTTELGDIQEARRRIYQQQQNTLHTRDHSVGWMRPAADFVAGKRHHNPSDFERQGHAKVVADCDMRLSEMAAELAALDRRAAAIEAEMSKP